MKIGFIGIGVMGQSMVRNLMKKGYDVSVYNRTKAKAEAVVQEGAHWCDSPGAVSYTHLDVYKRQVSFF